MKLVRQTALGIGSKVVTVLRGGTFEGVVIATIGHLSKLYLVKFYSPKELRNTGIPLHRGLEHKYDPSFEGTTSNAKDSWWFTGDRLSVI